MSIETQSAGAQTMEVSYSVLGPGRRVEWEEVGDGIVLRIAPAFPPKHSRWFVLGVWIALFSLQSFFISWGFFIFLALAGVLMVLARSHLRFWGMADSMENMSAPRNSNYEPIVLEVRCGRLFIYDPVAARKPKSAEWILDLEKVAELRVASPPWPIKRCERGELRFVLKDATTRKALSGHEVGELNEIVRLLRPWMQKAQQNPGHNPTVQPLAARPRIEFFEDADGFVVRIPVPRRAFHAPRGLRRLLVLIVLCGLSWVIMRVVAAGTGQLWLNDVAGYILGAGITAGAGAMIWTSRINRRRGSLLECEQALPITIEVLGHRLRRHDPQLFGKNLSLPLHQIAKVEAKAFERDLDDAGMGSLELLLNSARRIELIAMHELAELQELALELEDRIGMWKAQRVGG